MATSPQYSFVPVIADKKQNLFVNHEFIPQILILFEKYKNVLLDDYYSKDSVGRILEILEFINSLYPHFYAILKDGDFMGFVCLYNWQGSEKSKHCCYITTCLDRKYWGKDSLRAGKNFIRMIFDEFKLKKLKAEIFGGNFRVKRLLKLLGFSQEGCLKAETYSNGKLIDVLIYSTFASDKFV